MAIDPDIKKKANDIRNKIYGKEVRESLASGLEAMSKDVVENEGRQSVVEGRQDSVESQWQAVSDEMTDKDVISAPEIIAARDGEANLKARLDKDKNEVTTQLAQIAINVELFGAIPDGLDENPTDNYQAFMDAISYANTNGYSKIYIPGNRYYLSKTIPYNRNGLEFEGSGERTTTLVFKKGVHGFEFSENIINPIIKNMRITTKLPDIPTIEENWDDVAALKFPTESNKLAITGGVFEGLQISNFYKGIEFRDYVWQTTFRKIRLSQCGYSIYQHDAFSHTSIQNSFENIYSNNPFFGGLRSRGLQAEFISPNFGSSSNLAYMMDIGLNSNLLFTVGNWEEAHITSNIDAPIKITDGAIVTLQNPSLKDLKNETGSTNNFWMTVKDSANVTVKNHRFFQKDGKTVLLGEVYGVAKVFSNQNLNLSSLWVFRPDEEGRYRQTFSETPSKSVISNVITLNEEVGNDDRIRQFFFFPNGRGILKKVSLIYIRPHESGYGEVEVFQITPSGSKIKLANTVIKDSGDVSKNKVIDLTLQNQLMTGEPVYVGGFGLGTVQVIAIYND